MSEVHYCIWCLGKGAYVPTRIDVQMGVRAFWPACMGHLILEMTGRVVCV